MTGMIQNIFGDGIRGNRSIWYFLFGKISVRDQYLTRCITRRVALDKYYGDGKIRVDFFRVKI